MKAYPDLNKAIAKVLYQRRMELALSKKKLSDKAQITRIHISDLEQGTKNPTVNALFYLCDALDLDPKDFIGMVQKEMKSLKRHGDAQSAANQNERG